MPRSLVSSLVHLMQRAWSQSSSCSFALVARLCEVWSSGYHEVIEMRQHFVCGGENVMLSGETGTLTVAERTQRKEDYSL